MGLNDGQPIGMKTVLDHGDTALRWDLVIVADGYKADQQGVFDADVDVFARSMTKTAPFDAIDVESAINIHQINVASTDEGVDDPVACGGTDVMKSTYFDASLCADGQIARTMKCSDDLVKLIADFYVSNWNAVVLLANSVLDGGTTTNGVSKVTKSHGWADTILHELGHLVFNLDDEYAYLADCFKDPPAQNVYGGPEPASYNNTKTLNPLKWANLLPPGQLSTMTNPNCQQCDTRVSLFPAGTVGAFEGAHTYHCGVFRPEWTCKMKDEAAPFCTVCDHAIRNALAPYIDFWTDPDDQATQVECWPVTLKWMTGAYESSWEVAISEFPTFPSAQTLVLPSTSTEMIGAMKVGFVDYYFLAPGKTYWWKVRKGDQAGTGGWTQPRSFAAKAKAAMPSSPRTTPRSRPFYPWKQPFKWTGVDKAKAYEIQVTLGSDTTFASPLFTLKYTGTKHAVDLMVEEKHLWRVRAIPNWPDEAVYGPWSQPAPVTTSMPWTEAESPIEEDVYPWPVTLEWKPVKACDHYLVEIARDENGYGAASASKSLKVLPPNTTISFNLRPRYLADDDQRFWRVRVFGPELPTSPPLRQEGKSSDDTWFRNWGDDTIPVLVDNQDVWMGWNGLAEVKWHPVEAAAGYLLVVRPVREQGGYDETTTAAAITLLEEQGDYAPSPVIVYLNDPEPDPAPGVGIAGYAFNPVAIGPESLFGLGHENIGVVKLIDPTAPTLNGPSGGDVDYDNVVFSLTSPYTPSGRYQFAVLDMNTFDLLQESTPGNPGALTEVTINSFGVSQLKPEHTYQWWAAADSDLVWNGLGPISAWYPLGGPLSFTTKPKPPPPPPDTPWVPTEVYTNALGYLLCFFKPSAGATHYQFEVQEMDPTDPSWQTPIGPVVFEELEAGYCDTVTTQNLATLGAPPELQVMPHPVLLVARPGASIFSAWHWRVAACADGACSAPSIWSRWWEDFPWNWAFPPTPSP